ncbi:CmcI family methyltransferase [Roseibium marinum]|uniref:Cephalosporin hydroxylase n=1 Tax=Roseibium marinum TaxID=281252 RepID=A0A2S3US24_9HYPH|nr:CmcI family methyltransferase [Roseibium marinum]POF30527.1 cephalosporin hydroxylase [Roseibium marinum]
MTGKSSEISVPELSSYLALHCHETAYRFETLIGAYLSSGSENQTGEIASQNPSKADADLLSRRIKAERLLDGIPKYIDNYMLTLLAARHPLERFDRSILRSYIGNLTAPSPRFVSWKDRQADLRDLTANEVPGTEWDKAALLSSQGASDVLKWRDVPVFKPASDMMIYAMLLFELKPATIVEFGTGHGGSTGFMSDLAQLFGLDCDLHSVDRTGKVPEGFHTNAKHHIADCLQWVRDELPKLRLARPCLFIEDFHEKTDDFLNLLVPNLDVGDYLVIEDSFIKQAALDRFLREHTEVLIDTFYTDFFGVNCTSAVNSILSVQSEMTRSPSSTSSKSQTTQGGRPG